MGIRDAVVDALVKTGKWSEESARLSERAGHRCEYCGLDFLASPENYKQWQRDHIVPLWAGGKNEFDNLAAACRTCNVNFKSRWNPLKHVEPNPNRKQLIEAAKNYIMQKIEQTRLEVNMCREIAR